MTMTTLSSDGRLRGLCANMLKRSRSYMLYFGVLCFVIYPLQYILHVMDEDFPARILNYANNMGSLGMVNDANLHITDSSMVMLFMVVLAMTAVIGLSQFSYLHSKKAVDVYHAMPVRRTTLLLANILSAFVTVMVPLALNYLVVLAVGIVIRIANPLFPLIVAPLLLDLLCWAALVLTVLCIIAFVAVQVGSVFDNFVFSCELLVVIPIVIYMTLALFEQTLRGFNINSADWDWLMYTSPITAKIQHYSAGGELGILEPDYLIAVAVMVAWMAVSVLLVWASARIYYRRPSEMAESSSARGMLARVGVMAGVYIAGNFCGIIFSDITGRFDPRRSYVVWTVIFSALIYVFAQMVLLRGFRGMKKTILPGVFTVAAIGVFAAILATGGLGYETRVPDLADVESVTVNYRGRYGSISLMDAESRREYEDEALPGITQYRYNSIGGVTLTGDDGINAVRRLHTVASDRDMDVEDNSMRRWTSYVTIQYQLTNGRTLKRYYNYGELTAVKTELLLLEDNEEFKRQTHPVFTASARDYLSFEITDSLGARSQLITDQTVMQRLMDALAADMLAERVSDLANDTELAVCTLWFNDAVPLHNRQLQQDAYVGGVAMVRPDYTNTLRVLQESGLADFTKTGPAPGATLRVYSESWWNSDQSPVLLMDNYNSSSRLDFARQMGYNYSEEGEGDNWVLVTDPAEVAAISEGIFTVGCPTVSPLSVVYENADGSFGGVAQISFADLPASVAARFADWVRNDYVARMQEAAVDLPAETVAVIGGADGPTSIVVQ